MRQLQREQTQKNAMVQDDVRQRQIVTKLEEENTRLETENADLSAQLQALSGVNDENRKLRLLVQGMEVLAEQK